MHVCFEAVDLINGLERATIGRVTSTLAVTDICETHRIHSSVLGLTELRVSPRLDHALYCHRAGGR